MPVQILSQPGECARQNGRDRYWLTISDNEGAAHRNAAPAEALLGRNSAHVGTIGHAFARTQARPIAFNIHPMK